MTNKTLILVARTISMLFAPFYFPVIAFVFLFLFSFMKLLPVSFQLTVLIIVYLFTVAFPLLGIWVYRRINGWTRHQSSYRSRRIVPYVLSICSYGCCLYVLWRMQMPRFTMGIIVASLSIQIVCAVLNRWIKVSVHSAAAGGVVGALISFSLLFNFDPTWWLCLTILLAGAVGSSRIVLRTHNLMEVLVGLSVGFVCGLLSVLYI